MTPVEVMGLVASIVLPFWNIPLILGIERRKSSKDISLAWALGVWTCFAAMLPAAIASTDVVFKVFGIINIVCFSAVVIQVLRYRK